MRNTGKSKSSRATRTPSPIEEQVTRTTPAPAWAAESTCATRRRMVDFCREPAAIVFLIKLSSTMWNTGEPGKNFAHNEEKAGTSTGLVWIKANVLDINGSRSGGL